jgi:hypothetical protein
MEPLEPHERRERLPQGLRVQLPQEAWRSEPEEAAITREALEEAWQVLLAPFGLQVLTPPASTSAPGAVGGAGHTKAT